MYKLIVIWKDGRETVQAQGYNPSVVRGAESTVSRNARAISAIQLRDLDGTLETLWRAEWPSPKTGGSNDPLLGVLPLRRL